MSAADPFLVVEQPCNEAVAWIVRQVSVAGMQVMCTFDLQAARYLLAECPCPHHGTGQCDCQMVVLLVYGENQQPASLVAHSHAGKTWLYLVDTPQQRPDPQLEISIRQALPADIG